jgi:predicted AlkP superfamily pyrophosphatase or phosphodiesterase
MDEAQNGEDGELMYEMEQGGMKDGSSTGESSERDDSEEADRRKLGMVTRAQNERGRSWRRWFLIHLVIGLAFCILFLLAWRLSKKRGGARTSAQGFVSNGTALFAPTTIILSLDGFRADFLQRGITPRLNAFVKEGVSPKYMLPSFPSVTFPNHYTLATGLYPESHGVVGNTFWDPTLKAEFYYTDPARSLDPKWWGGEPFWVTAERQGVRTAVHMWPGSEAHVLNVEPSLMDKYNGKELLPNKVKRIFDFLDMPGREDETVTAENMRPQLIAAYVPNVDSHGHKYGPNSTEIRSTITSVDTMLDDMFRGLEERNLTNIVNVIVVSDHGMATTDTTRLLQLEDLIDVNKIEHMDGWPLFGLRPKNPDDLQSLYDGLAEKSKTNPNFEVYLRDVNMPERYHFSKNDRIAPLWIVPKTGWAIVKKEEFDVVEGKKKGLVYHPRGLHGYDHEHPLMRAIFVARGPAFPHPANSQIDVFRKFNRSFIGYTS